MLDVAQHRAARGESLSWAVRRKEPAGSALFRRTGDRTGAGGRPPATVDGRSPHSLPCLLPHRRRSEGWPIHLRGGSDPWTARASPRAAWSRSRHGAGDFHPDGVVPQRRGQASSTKSAMPDVPPPEELPSEGRDQGRRCLAEAWPEGGAALLPQRAPDRAAPGRVRPLSRPKIRERKIHNVWIRTAPASFPNDPANPSVPCWAYASRTCPLLDAALVPHGRSLFEKEFMGRKPRPMRSGCTARFRPADEMGCSTPAGKARANGPGFARLFFRSGLDSTGAERRRWVANVTQEGLVRIRRPVPDDLPRAFVGALVICPRP